MLEASLLQAGLAVAGRTVVLYQQVLLGVGHVDHSKGKMEVIRTYTTRSHWDVLLQVCLIRFDEGDARKGGVA